MMAMGVGVIVSRWPFQITMLNNHDAINYALALDLYDMRLHQPQPPGYPLYILLGRLFNLIFHDHLAALVWLSAVFSGLAVVAIYLAGRDIFGRRAGVVAALLLATSSVFWFQGEIAAPYTIDLFASAMVGWLCYRLGHSPERAAVWVTALAVGLTGAFRLQTITFLFPLFLYALRRCSRKTIAGAVLGVGSVFAVFFVPAVVLSGGPEAFIRSMRLIVPIFSSAKTMVRSVLWNRFAGNADAIARYTFQALGELVIPFVLLGYAARSHRLRFWQDSKLFFLAIWTVPAWIIYILIWPGNIGTILVCMPPLFLLAGAGVDWVMSHSGWIGRAGWGALAVALGWQIALFTILPQYPFGEHYRRFDNYDSILSLDRYYRAKLFLVSQVPVGGTVVYANAFRHLQYYLPQYRTFSPPSLRRSDPNVAKSIVSVERGAMQVWNDVNVATLVPAGTERIVLFDLPGVIQAEPALVEEHSKDGCSIQILSVPAHYRVLWTLEGLSLQAHE